MRTWFSENSEAGSDIQKPVRAAIMKSKSVTAMRAILSITFTSIGGVPVRIGPSSAPREDYGFDSYDLPGQHEMLLDFSKQFFDLVGGIKNALRLPSQMRLHADDLKMVFHFMDQMIDNFCGILRRLVFLGCKNSSAHPFFSPSVKVPDDRVLDSHQHCKLNAQVNYFLCWQLKATAARDGSSTVNFVTS
jgi:hypothetical protein